ncbi:helix-turn-helix domain-containing protein [Caulobacter vibrioides]|uniref:helix-turn-helix domain-containing protein n=1 Tax=Caulobacter vibrioides TaxID=155892 RepID=UPI000BB4939C|nr:helix-turn-helix transcriptional regulator [Caulobacter vibrioides]ATC24541.1 XRE family transcriptional regulator [Caulobacter vibrioides]PLR15125.1 XRE family transcriptional regulator [Caulobacter vibrioides]
MDGLGSKLELALKALSMSRARMAAELAVDKSLVGRWVAGKVVPSAHNLARLTTLIAEKRPGFTMLDWDRDLDGLAAALGVETAADAAETLIDWIPPAILREALQGTAARGGTYVGIWRSTRPSSDLPGRFLHDHLLIQRDPRGLLRFRTGVEGVSYEGGALLLQHQLFSIAADKAHGTLLFSIFNGVARQKAEILDGVTLACLRDAGGSPAASTCLLERICDLTGDDEEDVRIYEGLIAAQGFPLAPEGSISEAVRAHLTREADPAGMGVGGLLRMYFGQSMARGASLEGRV